MPVLIKLTRKPRPGKRVSATAVPSGMPKTSERRVAVAETRRESHVISHTWRSPPARRVRAWRTPCQISSTIVYWKSASLLLAMGTKSGWPYLSTPKVLITAWVSGASMKSAKALPPAAFTRGPLAGFTSITE